MKKSIWILVLTMCLTVFCANAETTFVSGVDFEEAQYVKTILESCDSYSYTALSYEEETPSYYMRWYGKAADGGLITYAVDSDLSQCEYVESGVGIRWDMEANAYAAVLYLPDQYAEQAENWLREIAMYPNETVTLTELTDGLSIIEERFLDEDGNVMTEAYIVQSDTLRLVDYELFRTTDETDVNLYSLTTFMNAENPLPEQFTALLAGERSAVTLVAADGESYEYSVPAGLPVELFADEADYALYADDAKTEPIDQIVPGSTLYIG